MAVNVWTEGGRTPDGVTAKNFSGKYHGQPIQILSGEYDERLRRVLIVLDTSGSMIDDERKWRASLAAAASLVLWMPPQTRFALLTFSGQVEDRIDFKQGRRAVAEDLALLGKRDWSTVKGLPRKTAMLDAIVDGVGLLKPPQVGDALFLISDGGENASHEGRAKVRRQLVSSGIRLFGFFPLDSVAGRSRTTEEAEGSGLLGDLVRSTGGNGIFFDDGLDMLQQPPVPRTFGSAKWERAEISSVVRHMTRDITAFYRLKVRLPEVADKPREWKLEFVRPSGKRDKQVYLNYPRLLAPCD